MCMWLDNGGNPSLLTGPLGCHERDSTSRLMLKRYVARRRQYLNSSAILYVI